MVCRYVLGRLELLCTEKPKTVMTFSGLWPLCTFGSSFFCGAYSVLVVHIGEDGRGKDPVAPRRNFIFFFFFRFGSFGQKLCGSALIMPK